MNPAHIVKMHFGAKGEDLFLKLLNQKPEKADAIVFLQGDRFDRALKVALLYEQKYADQVLVVGNDVLIGKGKRPDENDVSLKEIVEYLTAHAIPREHIFVKERTKDLLNTLGQATDTIQFAKEKKFRTLLVVASPYLLLRSYLTFAKQAKEQAWEGKMIFQGADLAWNAVPSGRTKTALEMLGVEMEKIKMYAKDISTIEEGIFFMQEKNDACKVRQAKQEDLKRIWEIRNDPVVRTLSSSEDAIPFENHVKWFEQMYVNSKKNLCFVIEHQGNVAGYCRFDFDDKKNAYNVSIAVDPVYHGKGLGHMILSSALLQIPRKIVVNAAVKKKNPVSVALFKKNGFAIAGEDDQYYHFRFTRRA